MTKIVIIIPSRGLIHSRTVEDLMNALSLIQVPYKLYFSHDNILPDCFNIPAYKALESPEISDLIIIEEDMEVPLNTFNMLLESKADIAYYDYPLEDGRATNTYDNIVLSGTGLIRFKRESLAKLLPFRTYQSYQLNPLRPEMIQNKLKDVYGKHDIDLFYRAQVEHHMTLEQVGVTGHYKIEQLGEKNTNKGVHAIYNLKDLYAKES